AAASADAEIRSRPRRSDGDRGVFQRHHSIRIGRTAHQRPKQHTRKARNSADLHLTLSMACREVDSTITARAITFSMAPIPDVIRTICREKASPLLNTAPKGWPQSHYLQKYPDY